MDKWLKTTTNPHSIAKTLYTLYKDRLRYNEQISKWQYFDEIKQEWLNDYNSHIIKEYFVYESRIIILNYVNDMQPEENNVDEIMDFERLIHIANKLSTHFSSIIKEAKEFFIY